MQDRPAPVAGIVDGPLPSGRHSLTRDTVLASQRGRLLDAMAEAVAERGYGATTIAHVVERAGVSRKTFYEHFDDKQDCFLAMYDTGVGFVVGRLEEALAAAPDPRGRVVAGLHTVLSVLAEEPAFCRAIVLEGPAAGPAGRAKRRAVLRVFADRYLEVNRQARAANPAVEVLSPDAALGVVGAILELVAARIDERPAEELPQLAGELEELVIRNVLPCR